MTIKWRSQLILKSTEAEQELKELALTKQQETHLELVYLSIKAIAFELRQDKISLLQESEIAVLKNMFTLQQQQLERIENLLSQRQFLS